MISLSIVGCAYLDLRSNFNGQWHEGPCHRQLSTILLHGAPQDRPERVDFPSPWACFEHRDKNDPRCSDAFVSDDYHFKCMNRSFLVCHLCGFATLFPGNAYSKDHFFFSTISTSEQWEFGGKPLLWKLLG